MITAKFLNGRLGEIMFMTYGLFFYCIKNKIPVNQICLNYDYIGQDYFQNKFNIIKDNFKIFKNIDKYFIPGDIYKNIFSNSIILDNNYKYIPDKIEYDFSKNYVLRNFWYFPLDLDLFKKLFYSNELFAEIKNKYQSINFNNSCSIHIRRGDYLLINNNDCLKNKYKYKKILSPDEIYKKINEFKNINNLNRKNITYLIFSDDIDWCKKNIKIKNCKYMNGNTDYEDMILISLCKYNIILSESFFNFCGILLKEFKNEE